MYGQNNRRIPASRSPSNGRYAIFSGLVGKLASVTRTGKNAATETYVIVGCWTDNDGTPQAVLADADGKISLTDLTDLVVSEMAEDLRAKLMFCQARANIKIEMQKFESEARRLASAQAKQATTILHRMTDDQVGHVSAAIREIVKKRREIAMTQRGSCSHTDIFRCSLHKFNCSS